MESKKLRLLRFVAKLLGLQSWINEPIPTNLDNFLRPEMKHDVLTIGCLIQYDARMSETDLKRLRKIAMLEEVEMALAKFEPIDVENVPASEPNEARESIEMHILIKNQTL